MRSTGLPTALLLRERLETILGRSVELSPGPPVLPTTSTTTSALYVDARMHAVALVAWDLAAATSLGAAATKHPPAVAVEALAARQLTPALEEGVRRVALDLATLFTRRHRQVETLEFHPPRDRGFDVVSMLSSGRYRLDLALRPNSYPAGRCTIVLPD